MAASGCAALTLSAATRASSALTVTWSALLPALIPTTYCMVTVAASSDPSHRACDVFAQRVRLALDFLEALLDHVADANHAAQLPVALDHRDVPDTSVGHQRHDRAHLIVARAGEHLLGHHAVDARAQHLGAVIGERPHDPRSERMPAILAPSAETTRAPTFSLRMRCRASETVASGAMVQTSRPLLARMCSTFIGQPSPSRMCARATP